MNFYLKRSKDYRTCKIVQIPYSSSDIKVLIHKRVHSRYTLLIKSPIKIVQIVEKRKIVKFTKE